MIVAKSHIEPKNFGEWLKKSVTAECYEFLSETTGISRHRLTKIERDATIATYAETRQLALALKKDVWWLVENFKLGYRSITIEQAEEIEAERTLLTNKESA